MDWCIRKSSILFIASSLLTSVTYADELLLTKSVEQLTNDVKLACPNLWEDLGIKMNDGATSGGASIWGINEAVESDQDDYSTFVSNLPNGSSATADFEDIDRILTHCTSARTALLSLFYSNLPQEVVATAYRWILGRRYSPHRPTRCS